MLWDSPPGDRQGGGGAASHSRLPSTHTPVSLKVIFDSSLGLGHVPQQHQKGSEEGQPRLGTWVWSSAFCGLAPALWCVDVGTVDPTYLNLDHVTTPFWLRGPLARRFCFMLRCPAPALAQSSWVSPDPWPPGLQTHPRLSALLTSPVSSPPNVPSFLLRGMPGWLWV